MNPFPLSISNSKLEDAACLIKFRQKHIDNIYPVGRSVHLTTGAAFASGLAAARNAFFVNGDTEEKALHDGFVALMREWDIEDEVKGVKNLASTLDALDRYLQQYPLPSSEPRPLVVNARGTVEFDFAWPLPIMNPSTGEPILYTGRCDMVGGNAHAPEYLFIVDEKTTGYLGQEWPQRMMLKGQLMGYIWAARKHGMNVLGAYVRGIAFRTRGEFDFVETPLWFREHHIDRWYESLLSKVRALVRAYEQNEWPYDFGHTCAQFNAICPYYRRCLAAHPDMDGYEIRSPHKLENW